MNRFLKRLPGGAANTMLTLVGATALVCAFAGALVVNDETQRSSSSPQIRRENPQSIHLAQAAPADSKVERQTAQPWTGAADAFEDPNREQTLRLPVVMNQLGLQEGSVVADIGAGGGWLSVRLAKRVGPSGTVYAQEILPKYTSYIDARAKRENLLQIKTILGTPTDPKLPANALDAVVILNAYHEFSEPLVMLSHIKSSLKSGARIGILERDNDRLRREADRAYRTTGKIKRRVTEKRDKNPLTDDHRLALPIVRRELETAGFEFVGSLELNGDHYLAVGRKK